MGEEKVESVDVTVALLRQSLAVIREDVTELRRSMDSFLSRLEQNYVPRTEYDTLQRRVDTLEGRQWASLFFGLTALIGGAVNIVLSLVGR